jgi:transposase
MEVYAWPQDVIRGDATTISGAHEVTTGGLWQCGQSQEDPTRPPIKVMMGALDPCGMPLSTDVLSGERADEGFSIPIMERIRRGVNKSGLRCVGDGKRSAFATRTHVARCHDLSLSP